LNHALPAIMEAMIRGVGTKDNAKVSPQLRGGGKVGERRQNGAIVRV
jgi:hypothetical protein